MTQTTQQALDGILKIEECPFLDAPVFAQERERCSNWPVVYVIYGKEAKQGRPVYVGETSNFIGRVRQHLADEKKRRLYSAVKIVLDTRFNKSAILDIEQSLIRLFKSDTSIDLQNGNLGQSSLHDYYCRFFYQTEVRDIWNRLELGTHTYEEITSSDTYKFCPYTGLTAEQSLVCHTALDRMLTALEAAPSANMTQIIRGVAGTGKTIVAVKLISMILEANRRCVDANEGAPEELAPEGYEFEVQKRLIQYVTQHGAIKIGYVVAMTSLRKTLQYVFKQTLKSVLKGSKTQISDLVIKPTDLVNHSYDILLVDEAHRLPRYKSISWMGAFKNAAKALGMEAETSTVLDWIVHQSHCRILFYDEKQSVRPSDIPSHEFMRIAASTGLLDDLVLTTQMRCEGGTDFIRYIDEIFAGDARPRRVENYDFRLFDDVGVMVQAIRTKNSEEKGSGLSRVVAGYAWPWKSKNDQHLSDIRIGPYQYRWNSTNEGWITSASAADEIGCVHTTQGFDLAYVGIIMGPDVFYDTVNRRIEVDRSHVFDKNTKKGTTDEELRTFILNSYKVMMSRGIKGCYLFVTDEALRRYLRVLCSA